MTQATRSEQERQIQARLARVEGQIRGIQKMIEERRPCDQILMQMMAARTALERTAGELVGAYVDECLADTPPEEARPKIARVVKLLARAS